MSNKGWWRFFIEINKNIEDVIIWKLNQLEIFSYAFDYSNKDKNISKLLILVACSLLEKKRKRQT